VTNSGSDYNSLAKVAKAAKETLEVEIIHVCADKGYDDMDEIEAQKPLQVYPVSETPCNAFALLKRRAKKKVVLHIRDDIQTQKLRLCLSEHPFGTIKWYHGAHYLLCKGIEKATGELGLSFLVYNMKRAIKMVGTKKLVAAMMA
jgi:hypothetical protein